MFEAMPERPTPEIQRTVRLHPSTIYPLGRLIFLNPTCYPREPSFLSMEPDSNLSSYQLVHGFLSM